MGGTPKGTSQMTASDHMLRSEASATALENNAVILNGVSPRAKAGAKRSEGSLTVRGRRRRQRSAGVFACRIACVPLASRVAAERASLFASVNAARAEAGGTHCDTASRRLALRWARLRPPGIPFRMTRGMEDAP